jgi:hypothetical protein
VVASVEVVTAVAPIALADNPGESSLLFGGWWHAAAASTLSTTVVLRMGD